MFLRSSFFFLFCRFIHLHVLASGFVVFQIATGLYVFDVAVLRGKRIKKYKLTQQDALLKDHLYSCLFLVKLQTLSTDKLIYRGMI
jgi:hypothetical protein